MTSFARLHAILQIATSVTPVPPSHVQPCKAHSVEHQMSGGSPLAKLRPASQQFIRRRRRIQNPILFSGRSIGILLNLLIYRAANVEGQIGRLSTRILRTHSHLICAKTRAKSYIIPTSSTAAPLQRPTRLRPLPSTTQDSAPPLCSTRFHPLPSENTSRRAAAKKFRRSSHPPHPVA